MGTMDTGGNTVTQTGYAFRYDDGENTAYSAGGASYVKGSYALGLNAAIDLPEDDTTTIRLRLAVTESAATRAFVIQRRIDSGSWFPVNTTDTAVKIGDTSYWGGGEHCPDNSGEELSTENYCTDAANGCLLDDPYFTTDGVIFGNGQATRVEIEMPLEMVWTHSGMVSGATVTFRGTVGGTVFGGGYDVTPTINITDAVTPGRTPYPYQQRVGSRILTR